MTRYETVFEDDGQTGYFYALDTEKPDNPICDAVNIYIVKNVTDRAKPSTVQIIWSGDGLKSALVINDYPHAVFDFADHRGYSRTDFPPPDPHWTKYGHEWHDSAIDLLK